MATLNQNNFTSWLLTPEEELSGSILSPLQVMVLQNKLSEVSTQLLNLELTDPYKPLDFIQQEAFLKGQMNTIKWLLDLSEEVKTTAISTKQSGV